MRSLMIAKGIGETVRCSPKPDLFLPPGRFWQDFGVPIADSVVAMPAEAAAASPHPAELLLEAIFSA